MCIVNTADAGLNITLLGSKSYYLKEHPKGYLSKNKGCIWVEI